MAKRKVASPANTTTAQPVMPENEAKPSFDFTSIWEKYQTYILYALGAVLLAFLGWWGYNAAVLEPKQKEAVDAMWQAELQFKRDSFRLALENPGGGYDGFLTIIDKFSGTKAANLSEYYAGICYLQLGETDNAITYLERFDADGNLLPTMKYGALGDAYSEKKDFDTAIKMYKKASEATDNPAVVPIYLKKLGLLYEYQGNKKDAYDAYLRIKEDYPNTTSPEWREIDKYLYRTKQ